MLESTKSDSLNAIQSVQIPQVYQLLETSLSGLSTEEAQARLQKFGENVIQEIKGKPLWIKFLANFTHLMAILLWVGGFIALIAKLPQIAIAIWLVNVINGVFSFWQEYKADKATEALKKMLPSYVRVLRDHQEQNVLAEQLVPGDLILITEGDRVSADGRLVQDTDLRLDQSTLSGESDPVRKTSEAVFRKDMARSDIPNLVFAGTTVAAGSGKAVIFATGMGTEFGKIAGITQTVPDELSPLQKEMQRVTKMVTVLAVSIGLAFFILAVLLAKVNLLDSFIFALGMIVAFVPEGMLPTVTLSLAMGTQQMAKRHALVKRLSAVETLGSTTVICTDKTGTLTQNEMTVRELWVSGRLLTVKGIGYTPKGQILDQKKPIQVSQDPNVHLLLTAAGLANNARLVPPGERSSQWTILGDPTEAALIVLAVKGGVDLENENNKQPRLRELPFDPRRKRMSTIHQVGNQWVVYTKGAPKEVLELCSHLLQGEQSVPLSQEAMKHILSVNDQFARNGLRVLAIAQGGFPEDTTRNYSLSSLTPEIVEQNLTFIGLVAMMDPPRPEVSEAVEKCHTAGIRVIMITGDYGLTAESIARKIGIVRSKSPRIITGVEMDAIADADLTQALQEEVIFARVAPENKLRVVNSLKQEGQIVAVTGDGVNDAPALKRADIGVAMGIAGTDVAKEAADMILTDDNFASIVAAIEEGRAVFANIRKFAMYVFNSNMAEAVPFVFFLFSRGAIPLPLTVMQILAIDLGTDMVPAIGLGVEPPAPGLMERKPRSQKEPLLNSSILIRALLWYGIIESVASMAAYFYFNWQNGWPSVPLASSGTIYMAATTMTLAGVVACQVGAVFACRTDTSSVFRLGFTTNRLVLVGIAVELALLGLLVYTPFLQEVFHTAPLKLSDWAFVFAWTPVIFLLDEGRKAIIRWRMHRHAVA
jgi:P-type Ca2+ transporter type 2C